jgi:hypothetical protein
LKKITSTDLCLKKQLGLGVENKLKMAAVSLDKLKNKKL